MTTCILLASPIDRNAVQQMAARHHVIPAWDAPRDRLLAMIRDAHVLVVRSGVEIDRELLDQAPRLRLLIRAGSGTDNLDLAALHERDIRVERIPEPGADAVAEMAIALLLALLRNLTEADRSVRAGSWKKHLLTGDSAAGRTLGIVGAGTIGSRVGRLGKALNMHPIGCVEHPNSWARARLLSDGIELATFDEVLSAADVVSLHVPLTPDSHHLMDRRAIGRMRPGSYLISLARGGVVDEYALREALLEGRLAGAALDVHAVEGDGMRSPLADLENVVLTPHIGAGTHEAQHRIGERVLALVSDLATSAQPPTTLREAAL
jgi:D-3-phosphoglycerate dehydrogenase / 2-oxoglutarate reductase